MYVSRVSGDPCSPQVFVKCHFDYDPASDSLIPCKEAGLRFAAGDLLQIVNQDDPNWWQVRVEHCCPLSPSPVSPSSLGAAEGGVVAAFFWGGGGA